MPIRSLRGLCFALLSIALLSGSNCGGNSGSGTSGSTKPLSAPVTYIPLTIPATCGGDFTGVSPATMDENAITLANYINGARVQNLAPPGSLPPDPTIVGVAQWQAQDMATHNYVGIVASDGEDAVQRIVCSGLVPNAIGIVAIGYSTDPLAVYNAITQDEAAASLLIYSSVHYTSLSVGYSNGYWMVIINK